MHEEETLPADEAVGAIKLPSPSRIGSRNRALAGTRSGLRNDPTTTGGDPSVFTKGLIIGF